MEEDRALTISASGNVDGANTRTDAERTRKELELYRSLSDVLTSTNTVIWWFERKESLPILFELSARYLCPQASSTPSERTFSTAGDTISLERARLLPEKADMIIFLHKNSNWEWIDASYCNFIISNHVDGKYKKICYVVYMIIWNIWKCPHNKSASLHVDFIVIVSF